MPVSRMDTSDTVDKIGNPLLPLMFRPLAWLQGLRSTLARARGGTDATKDFTIETAARSLRVLNRT